MSSVDGKIKNLLNGRRACLHYSRVDLQTDGKPDIVVDNIYAEVKSEENFKDIIVYLSKEDDESIHNTYELYRVPFIEDKYFLKTFLKEVRKRNMHNLLNFIF